MVAAALALAACSSGGSESSATTGGTKSKPGRGSAAGSTTTTAKVDGGSTDRADAAPAGKVATGKAVASKGCTKGTAKTVSLEKQTVGDRYYLLTVPDRADGTTPLPLVLDFHGLLEGAEVHATNSNLNPYAKSHGFVLATPNGSGTPIHWEVAPDRKANQDLVFVDAMLDKLEAEQCIDTSRIYSTGLSNGAFFSSTLACAMSDRVAAVAPVSGLTRNPDCKPPRPVPVLTFHGTADPILLFNGGIGKRLGALLAGKPDTSPLPKAELDGPGYPKAAKDWATANGCKATFTEKPVTKTVTQRTFDCPAKATVVFDIIDGGGHTWPGTQFSVPLEKIMGPTEQSIDANDVIWKFFQRFRLPSN